MTFEQAMIHTLTKENDKLQVEIGRLRQLLEQQSCEDCMSRQAVIDLINADWKYEGLELSVNELPPIIPILPKDVTNGDMIKAMFPNCKLILDNDGYIGLRPAGENWIIWVTQSWWNVLYKKEVEE